MESTPRGLKISCTTNARAIHTTLAAHPQHCRDHVVLLHNLRLANLLSLFHFGPFDGFLESRGLSIELAVQ